MTTFNPSVTIVLAMVVLSAPLPVAAADDAAAASAATGMSGDGYGVYGVSTMDKVRPDEHPQGRRSKQIQLFAAKNEGESAQLIISAAKALTSVVVTSTTLQGPGGFVITPEIRQVNYVTISQPSKPVGFGVAGRYPDPLPPMSPFTVAAGESKGVWITAWVPANAPAGDYAGSLKIAPSNAESTQVSIQLHVSNVTLPVQSKLKSCFIIWPHQLERYYGTAWAADNTSKFHEQALKYRITAPPVMPWDTVFSKQADGTWKANWSQFDRNVMEWSGKGTTAFLIGGMFGGGFLPFGTTPIAADKQPEYAAKLQLTQQHFSENGWLDKFYLYIFDEPPTQQVDDMKRLCDFIHAHAPGLKVLLTACYDDYPKIESGPHHYIDIWCPTNTIFQPDFLAGRKAAGDAIWAYVACVNTLSTCPEIWRIDWTGTSHRAMGWWLWTYKCAGFLYWNVNFWSDDATGRLFDLAADPSPFKWNFNGTTYSCNGDGFMFYPDPLKRSLPSPSLRLEIMRDGLEDYELLSLLADARAQLQANPKQTAIQTQLIAAANELLNTKTMISALDKFSHDAELYNQRHHDLLTLLERIDASVSVP